MGRWLESLSANSPVTNTGITTTTAANIIVTVISVDRVYSRGRGLKVSENCGCAGLMKDALCVVPGKGAFTVACRLWFFFAL